jgi:hypothetical protein
MGCKGRRFFGSNLFFKRSSEVADFFLVFYFILYFFYFYLFFIYYFY